jgi:hypothetical protein
MRNKEIKLIINTVLIFIAVLLIYGIFSPWITVATIFNVSGTSSVYGLFVFVSAFMFIVYGLTGLMQNSVLGEYQNLIRKFTLIVSTFTLLNLMYLIYRYLGAIKEFNEITGEASASTEDLGELGQSLDNLFENITNALKPTIGLGFYIILIGIVVGLILSIPVVDNKNIRLDKFGRIYAIIFLIIVTLISIFIYFSTRTSDASQNLSNGDSATSSSSPSVDAETGVSETSANSPMINEILVKRKLLTLVWNPVFDKDNKIIFNYQYRFKFSVGDWSDPLGCNYKLNDLINLKTSDTLSCDFDWSEVPETEINTFTNSESQEIDFVVRAIDDGIPGDWSTKPFSINLSEYPEFLGN